MSLDLWLYVDRPEAEMKARAEVAKLLRTVAEIVERTPELRELEDDTGAAMRYRVGWLAEEFESATMRVADSINITQNLGPMFRAAGCYDVMWGGEGIVAGDTLAQLEKSLKAMEDDPAKFKTFNAKNGWGLYEHAVPFLRKWIAMVKEQPTAKIGVSR